MSTPHGRLIEAIDQAEAIAKAAARDSNSDRWVPGMFRIGLPDMAEHIAVHDPATVLRGLAEDRDILRRHEPVERRDYGNDNWLACCACGKDVTYKPCNEVLSLARRHGVTP